MSTPQRTAESGFERRRPEVTTAEEPAPLAGPGVQLVAADVLALQRSVGNAGVQRIIGRSTRLLQREIADINLDDVELAKKVLAYTKAPSKEGLDAAKEAAREALAGQEESVRNLAVFVGQTSLHAVGQQRATLEQRATRVLDGYNEHRARTMEAAEGGHSIGRHGPSVTDEKLKRRLETGIAPDDAVSPAPGLSTRWASYEIWLKARQIAAETLRAAIRNTQKYLAPSLTEFAKAKRAFDRAPPGPAKGAGGALNTAVQGAKTGVQAACELLNLENPSPNRIQVAFNAGTLNPLELVRYKNGYTVIKNHGEKVGEGYRGTVQNPADPALYTQTAKVPELRQARTGMDVPAGAVLMDATADPNPADWAVFQHFPSEEPAEGIRS